MTIENFEAIDDRLLIVAGNDLQPRVVTEFAPLRFGQIHERLHCLSESCWIAYWCDGEG